MRVWFALWGRLLLSVSLTTSFIATYSLWHIMVFMLMLFKACLDVPIWVIRLPQLQSADVNNRPATCATITENNSCKWTPPYESMWYGMFSLLSQYHYYYLTSADHLPTSPSRPSTADNHNYPCIIEIKSCSHVSAPQYHHPYVLLPCLNFILFSFFKFCMLFIYFDSNFHSTVVNFARHVYSNINI